MPIIPIDLPPGVYKNGTEYEARGRWLDSNLVRWHDNTLQGVGGWQRLRASADSSLVPAFVTDPTTECARDIFPWRANDNERYIAIGTNSGAYLLNAGGVVTDISPTGVVSGSKDGGTPSGYGLNQYGIGNYGVANNFFGADIEPPLRWAFANFGEFLIALQRGTGNLYEYQPGTSSELTVVTNSPSDAEDVVVTDERIIFTIGSTSNGPRYTAWSDQEDRNTWTAASDNQAGNFTVPGAGRLLGGVRVLRDTLILGENDAHIVRYIGPPYIFSFEQIGENCGPITISSLIATNKFAAWVGNRTFWLYDGVLNELPCDVADFFYDDLDVNQVGKMTAATIADYSEIWWFYQSVDSEDSEVDSYVKWDYSDNTWSIGRLARPAFHDRGIANYVIGIDADSLIYVHELRDVLPSEGTIFAETGPLDIAEGERKLAIRYVYPDAITEGDLQYYFYTRNLPTEDEVEYGPFSLTNPISPRVEGRQIRMRVEAVLPGFRVGRHRFDYVPGSGR